jgi:phosphatidylserine/phosphatidylglycerophosphate/cardiolipin synthase-like enzyme
MSWLLVLSLIQANVYFASDTLIRKLKARIDAATSSIDLCIYNCDSSDITDALIQAKTARNVRVRVITDDARLGRPWLNNLRSHGVRVWTDSVGPSSSNLMHNKFAVFDRRDADPANDWVWTGSFNVAAGSYNADNAIEVQDSGLAHAYTQEFEQMWGGSDSLPNAAQAEFHNGKTDRLSRHRFVVGADTFRVLFSPQDNPVDTLARLVAGAQSEVGFAIYAFTFRDLALSMKDRHQHSVWVGGTFDLSESTNTSSYFDSLRRWGVPIYSDKFMGAGNLLHEKIMVIDQRIAATGSVNWSNAGNNSNDENSLLCYSSAIAARYRTEIAWRYNEAGGQYPAGAVAESPAPGSPQLTLNIAPNPFASLQPPATIRYSLPKAGKVSLRLYDVNGKLVSTFVGGHRPAGAHSHSLLPTRDSLAAGVYLLELEACGLRLDRKLIIE